MNRADVAESLLSAQSTHRPHFARRAACLAGLLLLGASCLPSDSPGRTELSEVPAGAAEAWHVPGSAPHLIPPAQLDRSEVATTATTVSVWTAGLLDI